MEQANPERAFAKNAGIARKGRVLSLRLPGIWTFHIWLSDRNLTMFRQRHATYLFVNRV